MKHLVWMTIAFMAGCGSQPGAPATNPHAPTTAKDEGAFVDAATWATFRRADYAIVAPRAFEASLAPLMKHRTAQGHSVAFIAVEDAFAESGKKDADALRVALRHVAAGGALRFVFLVGDVRHAKDADSSEVPTFYLPKVAYENHTREQHAPYADAREDHDTYPTDFPYTDAGSERLLAIGRLPARTTDDVDGFVRKVIGYESAPAAGAWRRRVDVVAGPADFGALTDGMIESIATEILDEELSYDYDVTFTFAKADSAYAYPFDKMREKFKRDLNDGALVAAYIGHGAFETSGSGTSVSTSAMATTPPRCELLQENCSFSRSRATPARTTGRSGEHRSPRA